MTVGLVPPCAVADRTRVGARAARADLERAAGVDPDDAAAAGPDLRDVEDRQLKRVAAALDSRLDERDPGRRPRTRSVEVGAPPSISDALAVVPPMSKRDDARARRGGARAGAGDDAGGRARLDDVGRVAAAAAAPS